MFGHGTTNALDEAAYLIKHSLGIPIHGPEPDWDARLRPADVHAALALIERRIADRIPAAYLTHEAWIGPHRFYVDRRVIVPRSYIGHWLRSNLTPWIDRRRPVANALDLCTGSGCLAVMLALTFPQARVDAVDLSSAALAVARRNVKDYGLRSRITLLEGDLFAPVADRRYDLIISNPPYVSGAAMRRLPAEYRHEPRLALAAGTDGLDLVRRIIGAARSHLAPGGLLVVEAGHARARVEAAWPALPFTWLDIGGVDDAVFLLDAARLDAPAHRRHP